MMAVLKVHMGGTKMSDFYADAERFRPCKRIFCFFRNGEWDSFVLDRLSMLKKKLSGTDAATLVLGAGVSQSVGGPSWEKLLARLSILVTNTRRGIHRPYNSLAVPDALGRELFDAGTNLFNGTDLLEIASYLFPRDEAGDFYGSSPSAPEYIVLNQRTNVAPVFLKDLVRRALLPHSYFDGGTFSIEEYIKTEKGKVKWKNTALYRVSKLSIAHFTKNEHRKNRRVITYNYDNFLEKAIDTLCSGCKDAPQVKTIYSHSLEQEALNTASSINSLYIYHPHGFLDVCGGGRDKSIKESDSIVLSEESYYEMEQRVYSWQNHLLSRALNDDLCLFIGFSGNDYNFRRIMKNLDYIPQKSEKQYSRYIIITIDTMVQRIISCYQAANKEEQIEVNGMLSDNDLRKLTEYMCQRLYRLLDLKEQYLKQKGFIPIWTTINDLPGVLEYLVEGL